MMHPLRVYGDGLLAGEGASPNGGHGVAVRLSDDSVAPLALDRYLGPADLIDESLLASVRGPVLDVGCGPGRHLHALARRGVFGLGVDLSPVAVELARDRGARAIVASIFDKLPGTGTWRTALLLDGNIGIGGGPVRLLARVGALLAEGGELLVELDPPGARTGPVRARLEAGGAASLWFDWAKVAFGDVEPVARDAGLTVRRHWRLGDRWFASLVCHRRSCMPRLNDPYQDPTQGIIIGEQPDEDPTEGREIGGAATPPHSSPPAATAPAGLVINSRKPWPWSM